MKVELNTVETKDKMNIEHGLKIVKEYRIFTSKSKMNVSFLMKPCHRKVKKLKANYKAKRRD